MSRRFAAVLALLAFAEPLIAGLRGHSSMYVAGTLTSCKAGDRGVLETGDQAITFTPEKGAGRVAIPYESITAMDYGEHVGRRVGLAIVVAWPLLFFTQEAPLSHHLLQQRP